MFPLSSSMRSTRPRTTSKSSRSHPSGAYASAATPFLSFRANRSRGLCSIRARTPWPSRSSFSFVSRSYSLSRDETNPGTRTRRLRRTSPSRGAARASRASTTHRAPTRPLDPRTPTAARPCTDRSTPAVPARLKATFYLHRTTTTTSHQHHHQHHRRSRASSLRAPSCASCALPRAGAPTRTASSATSRSRTFETRTRERTAPVLSSRRDVMMRCMHA